MHKGGIKLKKIKLTNGKIITPFRIISDGYMLINNGKIEQLGSGNPVHEDYYTIDADGKYISPGFIDIHTHGAGGHDFMDGSIEAFTGALKTYAEHGTTSVAPTTLTSTNEELKKTFEIYRQVKSMDAIGAYMLGIHLEGPYFSMEQKGAQDPRYIRCPEKSEYEEILSWSNDVIRWSAAPELSGAMEFARILSSRGILPSIAHSNANSDQVYEAFENGFNLITHFYSGMSGVHRIDGYRYAGVIESGYLIDEMAIEIIADGVHLPASLLKLIYKVKGPGKIALVSDSMRSAGMPEGESILGSLHGGQKVIVENGVAKLTDKSAFAGSVATGERLIRTMRDIADVPLIHAIQMATITPAQIIGISGSKGTLAAGKDADIVIFDDNIDVHMTIVGGRIVYKKY
jgi:N-acetylglucosamine-6-phosphate deacetylase